MAQHTLYVVRDQQTGKPVGFGMTSVTKIEKQSYTGKRLAFHGNYYDPPLQVRPGQEVELMDGDFIKLPL